MQTEPYEVIRGVPRLGWSNNIRASVLSIYLLLFSSATEIIFSRLEPYSPAQMFLWIVSNISFILYIITFYFDCRREYLLAKLSVEEREAERRKPKMSRFFRRELTGRIETMLFAKSEMHTFDAMICVATHILPALPAHVDYKWRMFDLCCLSFPGLCFHVLLILIEFGNSEQERLRVQKERSYDDEVIRGAARLGWSNEIRASIITILCLICSSATEIIYAQLEPYSPAQTFFWTISYVSFILYIILFYLDCREEYFLATLSPADRRAEVRKPERSLFFDGQIPGTIEIMMFAKSEIHFPTASICLTIHVAVTLAVMLNGILKYIFLNLISFFGFCVLGFIVSYQWEVANRSWEGIIYERKLHKEWAEAAKATKQ